MMIGAIVGDIAGSRFEFKNHKGKKFDLFVACGPLGEITEESLKMAADSSSFTDDTVMSVAIAEAIMQWRECGDTSSAALSSAAVRSMRKFGNLYPLAGYGGTFDIWLQDEEMGPYNSWGNGAAMRVSACGWAGRTLDEVKAMSRAVTEVTHNHPEGIKGAEATAVATFLARTGKSMEKIRRCVLENYYKIDFTLDEIRPTYAFDVSCQGSVPQALEAFFESTSFEDAIRNAISIGGDSDTLGAICGAVAGAYYGVPDDIREKALSFLDSALIDTLTRFEHLYTAPVGADDSAEVSRRKSDEKVLRFLEAQEGVYPAALREVTEGKKCGHWMWYVFPQLKGLGRSAMSERYGISDLSEARAYLRHPVLGRRLKDIVGALLTHKGQSAEDIFGRVDAMKLRSSMTLFNMVEYDSVFKDVLDTFYCSKPDGVTVDIVLAMARANPENMAHRVFANETYRIAAWHALGNMGRANPPSANSDGPAKDGEEYLSDEEFEFLRTVSHPSWEGRHAVRELSRDPDVIWEYARKNTPKIEEYKRDLCAYYDFLKSAGKCFHNWHDSKDVSGYHRYLDELKVKAQKLKINQADL